ncbi:MAG: amino acid adenylation domain-containing protein, partial [bacterium]|nr:amino acid adenylation domain-containing protein [bacterium]
EYGKQLFKEIKYWETIENTEVTPIPVDREITPDQRKRKHCQTVTMNLDKTETANLLKKANRAYGTNINEILLAALALALKEWRGLDKVLINMEGHGREPIIEDVDINRTVGWFTSMYPLLLDLKQDAGNNLSYTVKSVKETLRRIPNKGINYGVLKYLTSRSLRQPLCGKYQGPEITFNYLGEFSLGIGNEAGLFKQSTMSSGDVISPEMEQTSLIEINGIATGDGLRVNFLYNPLQLHSESIEHLAAGFKSNLQKIIRHTMNRKEKELTPSDLGTSDITIEELEGINRGIKRKLGEETKISGIYPLSPMQKGMLFHHAAEKETGAYFEQTTLAIEGELEIAHFKESFRQLIGRYEIFRTLFIHEGLDKPLQLVLEPHENQVRFIYKEITHIKETGHMQVHLETMRQQDKEKGFELSEEMPVRLSVFKTGAETYHIIWSFSHIIMDGWCMGIIFKELMQIYTRLKGATPQTIQLEPVTPYREYIRWLEKQDNEEALEFWRDYLEGYEQTAVLPKTKKIKAGDKLNEEYRQANQEWEIETLETTRLIEIAKENGTTLNLVLQALWGLLLMKYNNNEDVVFGAVVSGRPAAIEGIEKMVGLFINTVPVRVSTAGEPGIDYVQILKNLHTKTAKANAYEYQSLAEIQAGSHLKRELFDHIMIFENYPVAEEMKQATREQGSTFEIKTSEIREQTNYSFNIIFAPGKNIKIKYSYNAALYDKYYVERIKLHFYQVIKQVIGNPYLRPDELLLLTEKEKQQILYDFNDTAADYPGDKTLHQLFEEQVRKTPDRISTVGTPSIPSTSSIMSIMSTNETPPQETPHRHTSPYRLPPATYHLTYRELNEKANRLAQLLQSKGAGQTGMGAIVAIMAKRSVEMIIGLLGILKTGAAYLPIDPDTPQERINYMLKDSNAKMLLKEFREFGEFNELDELKDLKELKKFKELSELEGIEIIDINTTYLPTTSIIQPPSGTGHQASSPQHPSGIQPLGLAYIIYTSGTTGKPKGVLIDHPAIVNMLTWRKKHYSFSEKDVVLQITSYTFDASVEEIFTPLISGSRLISVPAAIQEDLETMGNVITRQAVTHFSLTPHYYKTLLDEIPGNLTHLRFVTVGGGSMDTELLKEHFRKLNNVKLYNEYGPTENSVCSTVYELTPDRLKVLIGNPINNVTCCITDTARHLVPVGVTGELCLSGEGLSRGYLNNPELTAERFIRENFKRITPPNNRYPITDNHLYRTGDLCCWMPDGNIEFLGRMDHQVKIRGFRIELGEIENRLSAYPGITGAVVLALQREDGDNNLCAYYVVESTQPPESGLLASYLGQYLPAYMIPTLFVKLEKIPLTPNGKIDRKALARSPITGLREQTYQPPRDENEKELAGIWTEILGTPQEEIGIDDDFFQIGGHSLKATRMAARIHKHFNIKLTLSEIFKTPTIRALTNTIKGKKKDKFAHLKHAEKKEYYVLSSAQERLYILQQMELESTAYNMPGTLRLPTGTELTRLENIFKQLIQRHESLRTAFHMHEDQPVQEVCDTVEFEIEYYANNTEDEVRTTFFRPFDLAKAPLLRVGITETIGNITAKATPENPGTPDAPDVHDVPNVHNVHNVHNTHEVRGRILLIDMHHIITDGTSQELLIREFNRLNQGGSLAPLELQYKDYAEWQRSAAQKQLMKQQETFWLNRFAGEIPVLELPTDYPRPAIQGFEGAQITFALQKEETRHLRETSVQKKTTLYMTLQAVFTILISKLAGQEDIIIGTPTAGRRHADLEYIIGMFVNTLAMRNNPGREKNIDNYLLEVKKNTLQAFENQEYQFEDLVDRLNVRRDTGRNPIFDVMFNLLNQPEEQGTNSSNSLNTSLVVTSKFDLTLSGFEMEDKIRFNIEYSTNLFKKETIKRFIAYFKRIIQTITKTPQQKISEIEIITPEEKTQILYEFNNTAADYTKEKTIHQLFEEQVEKTPDNVGLVGSRQSTLSIPSTHNPPIQESQSRQAHAVTYRELNEKSNRLAHHLQDKGVKTGAIIVIMVERSIEMIIGLLAILKTGAAYLPIDPDSPQKRINYMLKDSNTKILLTGVKESAELDELKGIVHIDINIINQLPSAHPTTGHLPPTIAYIIYTSGTTGQPKGTVIKHSSLVNLCTWHNRYYEVTAEDNSTQFASIAFDAAVWEIYPYLVKGASIHILDEKIKLEIQRLSNYYRREKITIAFLPTQYCHQFMEETGKTPSLRILLAGGDKLNHYVKRKYKLYNNYGPTENTVVTTAFPVKIQSGNIPIGKPAANVQIFITDKENTNLQPVGVLGELCIAGDGLAVGYLNNPELTAERFVEASGPLAVGSWQKEKEQNEKQRAIKEKIKTKKEHEPEKGQHTQQEVKRSTNKSFCGAFFKKRPLGEPPEGRFYRSGDLVRWLPDGNVEFLGRIDQQVKVRGYRIELGEIENRLLTHKDIKETVVLANEDKSGDRILCAYYVAETESGPGRPSAQDPAPGLKDYLNQYLPGYMIPTYLIKLEKIPLTPNGKIDSKALAQIQTTELQTKTHTAPRNDTEERLCGIWGDILDLQKQGIGIDDNFFDIGGHSLKATIMVSKIHKEFNVKLPLPEIFKNSTIRTLSETINECKQEKYTAFEPTEKKEYYPLSSLQERMFILDRIEEGQTAYNVFSVMKVEGKINRERFEAAFKALIRRHETFRTSFKMIQGQPVQEIHPSVDFKIQYPAAGENELAGVIETFNRPFDLEKAPILRAGLIKLSDKNSGENHLLIFNMHHIISDGTSLGILIREFVDLYEGSREPAQLRIQYKDFSQWQNSKEGRQLTKKQEIYWLKQLSGELPVLEMPTDYPRPTVQSFRGSNLLLSGTPELKQRLETLARQTGTTLFMVLMTAYNILLANYANQEDIIVGTPVSGRRRADFHNLIGLFINVLAIRNYPQKEKQLGDFLEEVKENTIEAFENQEYPFGELVETLDLGRNIARNPLYDAELILQNFEMPELETADLKFTPYEMESKVTQVDITLLMTENTGTLSFNLNYCTDLFEKNTMQRFLQHYLNILENVSHNRESSLGNVEMMTEKERQQIVREFNREESEYAAGETVIHQFQRQVEATPHRIALDYKSRQISYNQMNEKANKLARLLKTKGLRTGDIAGLMTTSTPEMMIAIFAILKAGGAYLPIAPDAPKERIHYMLKDSNAKMLLNELNELHELKEEKTFKELKELKNSKTLKKLGELDELEGIEIIDIAIINQLLSSTKTRHPESSINHPASNTHPASGIQHPASSLAYIIYTSGTTGR